MVHPACARSLSREDVDTAAVGEGGESSEGGARAPVREREKEGQRHAYHAARPPLMRAGVRARGKLFLEGDMPPR